MSDQLHARQQSWGKNNDGICVGRHPTGPTATQESGSTYTQGITKGAENAHSTFLGGRPLAPQGHEKMNICAVGNTQEARPRGAAALRWNHPLSGWTGITQQ